MSAFVILAAGRGTRIGRAGDHLHKALVPLDQTAIISQQIALAPIDARIIVCVGFRGSQITEYLRLAHPRRDITIIDVDGWETGGPGHSLLAAEDAVGDEDMIFTSCDTLWSPDPEMFTLRTTSWAAVAPIPHGTPPGRWCLMHTDDTGEVTIFDKDPRGCGMAYTGMAHILTHDLPRFWDGIQAGQRVHNEMQVTGGFIALGDRLRTKTLRRWIDVGDEAAYRRAVAEVSGYDWSKPDEVTYVLPDEGRVVKFWDVGSIASQRVVRAATLGDAIPSIVDAGENMLAYEFVPGQTGYDAVETEAVTGETVRHLLSWAIQRLWKQQPVDDDVARAKCSEFYFDKTMSRIAQLDPALQSQCFDAVSRIDWEMLCAGYEWSTIHGDFNLGNIIVAPGMQFVGIDWRQDFAGEVFGDRRYDLAKLLAGCHIHWGRARRGDFRPWPEGEAHAAEIRRLIKNRRDIEIIGALSLLNCAPLHAAPLDDVLVARGLAWLEELA